VSAIFTKKVSYGGPAALLYPLVARILLKAKTAQLLH